MKPTLGKSCLVLILGLMEATNAVADQPSRLPSGLWVGDTAYFRVGPDGARLSTFSCCQMDIAEPIMLNSDGRFEVMGKSGCGMGDPPKLSSERLIGQLDGDRLHLDRVFAVDGEIIDSHGVVLGRLPQFRGCL